MAVATGYRDYVERVRQAHSVEDLLQSRYNRPAENHYVLCPFHKDSNPSCSVNDQYFHCFSCKAGGDLFHLVQRLENCTFGAAVDLLAQLAGIPTYRPMAADRASVVVERTTEDATELACSYYEQQLTAEARSYLVDQRRLPAALVQQQRCGWADGQLVARLVPQFTTAKTLIQAGLATEAKNAATWQGAPEARDWLRDRVVFPCLVQGRARFLSGRTLLPDVEPKYLNQRDRPAPLYNQDALDGDYVVAVEGQVDTLSLMAWEIPAVGLLGTLHQSVVAQLRRPRRVYTCTDADTAGTSAAYKIAAAVGVAKVRVVRLPPGCDPNDFYRTHPKRAFLRLLQEAVDPVVAALEAVNPATADPGTVHERLEPLFQLWHTIPAVTVQTYLTHQVTHWAGGDAALVAAVAATWQARQKGLVQCPACGTHLHNLSRL